MKIVKIVDKTNNGGKIWAFVAVGGTAIGVAAANFPQLLTMLASIFGIK